jgi:hypothetical protein
MAETGTDVIQININAKALNPLALMEANDTG